MARKLLMLALVALVLTGCQKTKETPPVEHVIVKTEFVAYECGTAPKTDAVRTAPTAWTIQKDANGVSWYALTPQHYKNLMENMAAMITSGKQIKGQRDFYARCIDRSKEAVKKANASPE